ncbi:MAG TPA: ABC transporter substrate-binding protein [Actinomycetota bacterium]|nr:ABC transporter substrate-binding protein [Actinomycetota bacterium]
MKRKIFKALPALLAVVLLSTVSFATRYVSKPETRTYTVGQDGAPTDPSQPGDPSAAPGATANPGDGPGAAPVVRGGKTLECVRGRNGGATDTGVTNSSIKLGATVVKTGIGASFLKEVPIALQAVVNKVNRGGGVCGRLLNLKMVDDGWDAARGQQFIRNFISEGVFALAVSPSSEGLDAAIRNGDISKAGIPVVGADGMLISQYTDPWVWPVAASTITTMHVMAKNARDRGAKTFGLVYDKSYHFGVEGASAFRGAIRRMMGSTAAIKADIGIEAGQPSYKNDVDRFNGRCNPCDFVAMLLEPPTALQWIRDGASFGGMQPGGTGGPQPLFVDSFARACGQPCNGLWVWTGYTPPIPPFDDLPAVSAYVNDLRANSSTVDVNNPFVEGGYLGMQLLVKALRQVGPDLTRERLRDVLDSTVLDDGLTQPLRWRRGNHFANNSVQAFSVVMNNGSFEKWRDERTGWIADPWVGMDAPKR